MQKSADRLQVLFLEQGLIDIAYKIITFIDLQTLQTVIHSQVVESHQFKLNGTLKKLKKESKIKKMIQVHCFLKQYLNLTDRSMYYSFYDQPEFVCISKQLEQNIVIIEGRNFQPNLSITFSQMNELFDMIQNQQLLQTEELDELKRILTDPCLPLPPLKRQNEGLYCNSSFQLFLVGLRFPHYSQEAFSPFQELKQKISDQEDASFKQFFALQKQKHSSMKVYQNLHLVRYMPYEINYKNFKSLMLKDNSLHNMVVTLFAVTDVWIQAIFSIVNAIDDPFYKLVEMMSRYAVFRSFVIELEDSLGFLFKSYQNLYSDTIRDSLFQSCAIKPKYCFWRPALGKWFLKMSPIHQQTNFVYFMLLTKLREDALFEKLNDIDGDSAWKVAKKNEIILRNGLELNQLSGQMREKLYANMIGSSVIEDFISYNPDTHETLVFEYVQYFIDLAINEETVHWCGHSNHRLQKPFNLFNQEFSSYNQSFIYNLKNQVLAEIISKQSKKNILQLLIQADVEFLQTKNIKPIMLKSFLDDINMKGMLFEDLIEKKQLFNTFVQIKQTLKEQEIEKNNSQMQAYQQIVSFDFGQKDHKLKYFNEKANICESIEGQEKCFFSIPPLLSPQEILIKSINTNDTSENQDSESNSSFQYVSDNQSEQLKAQLQEVKFKYSNKNSQNSREKGEKKVKFQDRQEQQMEESQGVINEKKTLHSTNSSSKETQQLKFIEQNQKCPQKQKPLIVKSQSI